MILDPDHHRLFVWDVGANTIRKRSNVGKFIRDSPNYLQRCYRWITIVGQCKRMRLKFNWTTEWAPLKLLHTEPDKKCDDEITASIDVYFCWNIWKRFVEDENTSPLFADPNTGLCFIKACFATELTVWIQKILLYFRLSTSVVDEYMLRVK